MKRFSVLMILVLRAAVTLAQEFEVPLNPSLNTPADFLAEEPTVLAAIDWLMRTPLKEQQEKRKDVNAYLLQWMGGTKAVTMGLNERILTFTESSPDLLMIFMGAWVKYALETKEVDNQLEGNKRGMAAVIEYYTRFLQATAKDKNVEKYVKMRAEGTLDKYLEKMIKH